MSCSICQQRLNTKSQRDRHFRIHHTDEFSFEGVTYIRNAITKHFECRKCKSFFIDPKNLKEHLKKTRCAKSSSEEITSIQSFNLCRSESCEGKQKELNGKIYKVKTNY